MRDLRGDAVSGTTPRALEDFELALAQFLGCRGNPLAALRDARAQAPGFAMAYALEAYLHLGGRDPAGGVAAMRAIARFPGRPALEREKSHFAAIAALAHGEYERARHLHDGILADHPRDVIALQVSHSMDYQHGDVRSLRDRVAWVLPAWTDVDPGYHALLSMLAFGLEECREYARAEDTALQALALDPRDLRAHHAVTHVLEMLDRTQAGVRWMGTRSAYWADQGAAATHLWWHLALFHVGAGNLRHALRLHDQRLRAGGEAAVSRLIDASSLLWRLELAGIGLGERWAELAASWAPHAEDGFCAFNDVHAMMAFVGAGRDDLARALLGAQQRRIPLGGANGTMTRLVGLPACRALQAFGRGNYADARRLLERLPPIAHRLGGSHAQRDVLELTRAAAAAHGAVRLAA